MVTCTGCNKSFKKLHGLSSHRNKCRATLSGLSFEQTLSDSRSHQKKVLALKFRRRQDSVEIQPSDQQKLEETEPVRILNVDLLVIIINFDVFPQKGLDGHRP